LNTSNIITKLAIIIFEPLSRKDTNPPEVLFCGVSPAGRSRNTAAFPLFISSIGFSLVFMSSISSSLTNLIGTQRGIKIKIGK
jgi:hypothetical protein